MRVRSIQSAAMAQRSKYSGRGLQRNMPIHEPPGLPRRDAQHPARFGRFLRGKPGGSLQRTIRRVLPNRTPKINHCLLSDNRNSPASVFSLRRQCQPMCRYFLHLAARVGEWKIMSVRPKRQQVAVVWAAELAGLARRTGGPAAVPIGEVEEVAVRGAVDLFEIVVVLGVVGRVGVAGALDGAEVKRLSVFGTHLF